MFLLGILIFQRFTERRLYKSLGVKGLTIVQMQVKWRRFHRRSFEIVGIIRLDTKWMSVLKLVALS
jgi:hypothetical protein